MLIRVGMWGDTVTCCLTHGKHIWNKKTQKTYLFETKKHKKLIYLIVQSEKRERNCEQFIFLLVQFTNEFCNWKEILHWKKSKHFFRVHSDVNRFWSLIFYSFRSYPRSRKGSVSAKWAEVSFYLEVLYLEVNGRFYLELLFLYLEVNTREGFLSTFLSLWK